jgi:hypothetical protein
MEARKFERWLLVRNRMGVYTPPASLTSDAIVLYYLDIPDVVKSFSSVALLITGW